MSSSDVVDLLMLTRNAGRAVAAAKLVPFFIHDLSNCDASAPPWDMCHDFGKVFDCSIYNNVAGDPVWTSVCTPDSRARVHQRLLTPNRGMYGTTAAA